MISTHGVGLVARQEIRTRLRTGRWKALMAVWFLTVNGLGLMFRYALESESYQDDYDGAVPMFGGVLLAVLVLTLLITPALSAQSINGDRERGVLAALQITRLSPADIAFGKLFAAWGTGLLVLALTLPCVLLPVLEGAIGVGRAVVTLSVTALLIGVVCALAQAWSALVTRSITSVLLSYLTVFGLLAGTPLLFALALPVTAERQSGPHGGYYINDRPDRVWWLLAPNPVVILADAAPRLPEREPRIVGDTVYEESQNDLLGDLSRTIREIRESPGDDHGRDEGGVVWPYGLAFDLLLAGGALRITTRRLRTPASSLPTGVRLA